LDNSILGGFAPHQLTGNSSAVHYQDTIRHPEDLVNLGGDYYNTRALARETADEVMDFRFGAHVDAAGRLIEKVDTRSHAEPFSEDDLLLIPSTQSSHGLVEAGQSYAEIPYYGLGGLSQPARPEEKLIVAGKTEVKPYRCVGHQPFGFAVVRHEGEPTANRIERTSDTDLFAIEVEGAPIARTKAEDCFHEFRTAGANQSGQTEHFSGMYLK